MFHPQFFYSRVMTFRKSLFTSIVQKFVKIVFFTFGLTGLMILTTHLFEWNNTSVVLMEMEDEEDQLSELPLRIEDSLVRPLRELTDLELQKKLDLIVTSNKRWSRLVQDKKLCIGLVDMRDPYNAKYANVNGVYMMYAASLPKIAVLLSAEDALEKGEMVETTEITADMRLMIAKSNNAATTRMIDRVGFDKIKEVMTDPQYAFYDEDSNGGLWVGKRYAQSGERHGDPLKNISHGANANQVCRFYYLLACGKLINFERSKEMLGYLGNPELHHKFVNTLDRVAPSAKVFRKSGSWRDFHSDSVLVWGPNGRRYILVALAQDAEGENLMRNLMLEVDRKFND